MTVSRVDLRRRRRDKSLAERADALYPTAAAKDLHKSRRAPSFLSRTLHENDRAAERESPYSRQMTPRGLRELRKLPIIENQPVFLRAARPKRRKKHTSPQTYSSSDRSSVIFFALAGRISDGWSRSP